MSASVTLGGWLLEDASSLPGAKKEAMLARAERAFLSVREEAEDSPGFQLGYGHVLYQLGKVKEGEAQLVSALKSNDKELIVGAANVYRALGKSERARQILIELHPKLSGAPADSVAHQISILEPSLAQKEAWLRKVHEPGDGVRASLLGVRGLRALRQGQRSEAASLFQQEQAIHDRQKKSNSAAANNAALAAIQRFNATFELPRLDEAMADLRLAVSL